MAVTSGFNWLLVCGLTLGACALETTLRIADPDVAATEKREAEQVSCAAWNTEAFFEGATAADVLRCVEAGADPEAQDNDGGKTPLHRAARSAHPSVVTALLEAGAHPQARADDTPFVHGHDNRWKHLENSIKIR